MKTESIIPFILAAHFPCMETINPILPHTLIITLTITVIILCHTFKLCIGKQFVSYFNVKCDKSSLVKSSCDGQLKCYTTYQESEKLAKNQVRATDK
jgi:hypothetical protein